MKKIHTVNYKMPEKHQTKSRRGLLLVYPPPFQKKKKTISTDNLKWLTASSRQILVVYKCRFNIVKESINTASVLVQ